MLDDLFHEIAAGSAAEEEAEPVTPTPGTPTYHVEDNGGDVGATTPFSHTRASGAALVAFVLYKPNSNPAGTVSSVTFDATPMDAGAQDKVDAMGGTSVAVDAHYLDPGDGPTGANNIVATFSGTNVRDVVVIVLDVPATAGVVAAVADAVVDAGDTSADVAYTPVNAASLLLGFGGCLNSSTTLTAGSGWSAVGTAQQSNASDSAAIKALAIQKTAGSTSPTAGVVDLSTSRTARACAVIELAPS